MKHLKLFGFLVVAGLAIGTTSCGSDDEVNEVPDQTDASDASDSSDATDQSDASYPSDPTDSSDNSDASDPSTPSASGSCSDYLTCEAACYDLDEAQWETCLSDCEADLSPEALGLVNAYNACVDTCAEQVDVYDEDAFTACLDESCADAYQRCMAPEGCIPACDNYDEVCGEDGPLRSYRIDGQDVSLRPVPSRLILRLSEDTRYTPSFTGLDGLRLRETSAKELIWWASIADKKNPPIRVIDALRQNPAVSDIFPVYTLPSGQEAGITNEVVVAFKDGEGSQLTRQSVAEAKVELIRPVHGLTNVYLARATSGDALDASARLQEIDGLRYAEPDFLRVYTPRSAPNDPAFERQWHLENRAQNPRTLAGADLRALGAWETTRGDASVIVAINDDGVDLNHNDIPLMRDENDALVGVNLPDNLEESLNFGCCSHGTAVAGVSTAIGDNEVGTSGVCPGCTAMPVFQDFFGGNGDVATAETFTIPTDLGAGVINNSWGPPDANPSFMDEPNPLEPLSNVIEDALSYTMTEGRDGKGTLILFAGGNGNEDTNTDAYVSHPLTLGIAAVNAAGFKSYYSDFGDGIWVAAPSNGGHLVPGITTSDITGPGGYDNSDVTDSFGGTSSATPAASGVVGLILSANRELTALQVKDILRRTSRKIDRIRGEYEPDADGFLWSRYYGYGLVDAHAAVRAAVIGCDPSNDTLCVPASTNCEGGELTNVTEVCNGIDDDCDGSVDEDDVCPAEPGACEPCTLADSCGDGCVWLAGDTTPSCLSACEDDQGCLDGETCTEGLCVPASGRCSDTTEEVCDGVDNDGDGEIDEGACDLSEDGTCLFSGECAPGSVCLQGVCATTCTADEDCEDSPCLNLSTQYGEPDEVSVCDPGGNFDFTCLEACQLLYEQAPQFFDFVAGCITNATTCEEVQACVPLGR